RRTLVGSAAFVLLVLIGIDHWTVSSTTPALRDLPGVTNGVIARLRGAGWETVFRVAQSPVAELAYRANLSPRDARAAHDAARLATPRGIGPAHPAVLIGGGVGSAGALAGSAPDSVGKMARAAPPAPHHLRPRLGVEDGAGRGGRRAPHARGSAGVGARRPATSGPYATAGSGTPVHSPTSSSTVLSWRVGSVAYQVLKYSRPA